MSLNEWCVLKIFSQRFDGKTGKSSGRNGENYDKYKIKRTLNGWYIDYNTIEGECDKKIQPTLYRNLQHDGISYPIDLPNYLERLWEIVDEKNFNQNQLQNKLDEISNWINECEINKPDFY